jgi:hypothetical protein
LLVRGIAALSFRVVGPERVSTYQGAGFVLAMPNQRLSISGQACGTVRVVVALIGRQKPFDVLASLAAAATQGRGSLAMVRGAAGIGKTRLVQELAQTATGWGLEVAWSTCWEGSGAPAFWPWIHVLRDLGLEDAADRLDTGSAHDGGAEHKSARLVLLDSVARDLAVAVRDRGALVVIEDLHWADIGTMLVLRVVADRLGSTPLAMVITQRDREPLADPSVAEHIDVLARQATVVDLRALTPDEVAELAATLGTAADPAQLHRRSGGNPLFIHELVRLYESEGTLVGVPPAIGAVIARRLKRLAVPTREVLDVAAVAATIRPTGTVALLAAAADQEPATIASRLDEAARSGLVNVAGGTWEFTHAMIRDAVAHGVPGRYGAQLYIQVSDAIEGLGLASTYAAELAHLLTEAALLDQTQRERASDWNARAGDQAASVLAYESAAEHYRTALDLMSDRDVARRIEVQLALGTALLSAGDEPRARAAFDVAAALARTHGRADDLARAALGPGGFEVRLFDHRQIDLLHESLAAVGEQNSAIRARLLARLAVTETFVKEPDLRQESSREAVAIARQIQDAATLGVALAAHLDTIAGPAHVEERRVLAAELIELASSLGDRELEALALRFRVVALLEQGNLTTARVAIGAYAALAEALGSPVFQWYVPLWRAALALAGGDDAEAELQLAQAADLGKRAGSLNARMLVHSQRWEHAAAAGEVDVLASLVQMMGKSGPSDALEMPTVQAMLVRYDALRGDIASAKRALSRLARDHFTSLGDDSEWLPTLADLADAVVVLEDVERASILLELLAPYADLWAIGGIGAYIGGSLHHTLGRLASMLGRSTGAYDHFRRAYSAHLGAGATALAERTALTASGCGFTLQGSGVIAQSHQPGGAAGANRFVRKGDVWELRYTGMEALVRDAKGVRDIAALLASPERDIAASELLGARVVQDGFEILDSTARAAYKARLSELRQALDEAEDSGDESEARRAQGEIDMLVAELSRAVGLGGRSRRALDASERARKAVSTRITLSIRRIEDTHSALGRHLRHSIRTGAVCRYQPEHPTIWEVQA